MIKLKKLTCHIISEGLIGTENQCIGVAEALKIPYKINRIALKQPWKTLSPWLGGEHSGIFTPPLSPPWPDLLITSGRKSIAAARFIKQQSQGKTLSIHIQDPKVSPNQFDLVFAPAHDSIDGANVIKTIAAPNKITPEKLSAARDEFPQFKDLPKPIIAVLIGGNSRAHKLTPSRMQEICRHLRALPGSLLITTSRRTGVENEALLKQSLQDTHAYIWDGQTPNPYFAMLAYADHIMVTNDSASMMSEAATTGKPVHLLPLEGGKRRLNALQQNLIDYGAVRPFNGELTTWEYKPLNDAQTCADEILAHLYSNSKKAI